MQSHKIINAIIELGNCGKDICEMSHASDKNAGMFSQLISVNIYLSAGIKTT